MNLTVGEYIQVITQVSDLENQLEYLDNIVTKVKETCMDKTNIDMVMYHVLLSVVLPRLDPNILKDEAFVTSLLARFGVSIESVIELV